MLLGGSFVSTSLTSAASIVTVQVSLFWKAAWVSVQVVAPPVGVTFCIPETVQLISTVLLKVTPSLKVTLTAASTATPVAPSAGLVSTTVGAASTTAVWKVKT